MPQVGETPTTLFLENIRKSLVHDDIETALIQLKERLKTADSPTLVEHFKSLNTLYYDLKEEYNIQKISISKKIFYLSQEIEKEGTILKSLPLICLDNNISQHLEENIISYQFPPALKKNIIDFLSNIPNNSDHDTQQALVIRAGLDDQLQQQIRFKLSCYNFFPLLVDTIIKYGKEQRIDGKNPLIKILEAAKELVGNDKMIICDELIKEVYQLQ